MNEILRKVWAAVRPINGQQRFLWRCGTILIVSGLVTPDRRD